MTKLTDAQRAALHAAARGPLFRNASGSWSRGGLEPFQHKTVMRLVELDLVARGTTPRGIPMVTATPAGGCVLGVTVKIPSFRKPDADTAARAAAARHERIAP